MSIRCTICHRDLPESAFYAKNLKRYQYQCKECTRKKNNTFNKELKESSSKFFDQYYGGYIISILNHPSPYRYIIKGTNGYFFNSNDSSKFMQEVEKIIGSYTQ